MKQIQERNKIKMGTHIVVRARMDSGMYVYEEKVSKLQYA